MDDTDRKLLNHTQKGLELDEKPFHRLGKKLGITGEEVVERLKKLKNKGYIRRIGGVFDSAMMGYCTTLVAVEVAEDSFREVARKISAFPGVTHCYRRNHELNLWFTLITGDETKKKKILKEILDTGCITRMYDLPKERCFKLKVFFDMEKG